jgi:hypothetical protein
VRVTEGVWVHGLAARLALHVGGRPTVEIRNA